MRLSRGYFQQITFGYFLTFALILCEAAQAQTITEYPIPTLVDSKAAQLMVGPDGNLWFFESHYRQFGRVSISGEIIHFPLPQNPPLYLVLRMANGPDGKLWFTTSGGCGEVVVGNITPAGQVTEYRPPPQTSTNCWFASSITAGPDGNIWFTTQLSVVKISPSGSITEYRMPNDGINTTPARPHSIVAGADGNLWVVHRANRFARITTQGVITEFVNPSGLLPSRLIRAPDGNLWFISYNHSTPVLSTINSIGRVTPTGGVVEYRLPSSINFLPQSLTVGPDSRLWFVDVLFDKIGAMTVQGALTEYPLAFNRRPRTIISGPDRSLWFTTDVARIGRISTQGNVSEFIIPSGQSAEGLVLGNDGRLWFLETGNGIGVLDVPISLSDLDRVFGYLEAAYPQFLSPGNSQSQSASGYYYRYYATTNAYVGAANGRLYYLGPESNNEIVDVGTLASWVFLAFLAGY